MFRLSLRNIWSRKGRMLLTAIAVIAGTAFLNGVFVFTDTIKGAFNTMFENAYAGTDAYVRIYNNDGSEAGACGNGTATGAVASCRFSRPISSASRSFRKGFETSGASSFPKASATRNPMLCLVFSYSGPMFPRQAIRYFIRRR